jgi:hypothetical protein
MIKNKITQQLNTLLSAYINETLNPVQRKLVELWLERNEKARQTAENLKILQTAVQRQPRRTPAPAVFERIQAQIRVQAPHNSISNSRPAQAPVQGFPLLLLSLFTLLLVAAVVWQTLPPGIVLQWSVEGRTPETFRIYRAEVDASTEADSGQFELLEELPASETAEYTFIDFRLLPGQNYVYRVEGLTAAGQAAASQTIAGQGIDALPGQLAILLILLFTGYCAWHILRLGLRRPYTFSPI